MKKLLIKTHDTIYFRENYIKRDNNLTTLLKPNFDIFFIVKIEDMSRLMKLPLPPNRTQAHILIFITEGVATMRIGGELCRIVKDECLVIPSGQVFSFDEAEENEGFLCVFHPNMIVSTYSHIDFVKTYPFLTIWNNPIICLDTQTAVYIYQTFRRILDEYIAHGLKNAAIITAYLIALLSDLNRVYQPLMNQSSSQSNHLAHRFKELLFAHVKTKHLVTEYADMLHITPNHLNKVVKQTTGKSPTKWIDEVLILESKVLLYQTNLSINEIAAEIGLLDTSYFSRLFKKYENKTPLEFRKMIEKS